MAITVWLLVVIMVDLRIWNWKRCCLPTRRKLSPWHIFISKIKNFSPNSIKNSKLQISPLSPPCYLTFLFPLLMSECSTQCWHNLMTWHLFTIHIWGCLIKYLITFKLIALQALIWNGVMKKFRVSKKRSYNIKENTIKDLTRARITKLCKISNKFTNFWTKSHKNFKHFGQNLMFIQ